MRTVKILENFSGYPAGAEIGSKRRDFVKGEEIEVPNDFADLIVEKGHAREVEKAAKGKTADK